MQESLAVYHYEGMEYEPRCLDSFSEDNPIPDRYKLDTTLHLLNNSYFNGERTVGEYDTHKEVCKYCIKIVGIVKTKRIVLVK